MKNMKRFIKDIENIDAPFKVEVPPWYSRQHPDINRILVKYNGGCDIPHFPHPIEKLPQKNFDEIKEFADKILQEEETFYPVFLSYYFSFKQRYLEILPYIYLFDFYYIEFGWRRFQGENNKKPPYSRKWLGKFMEEAEKDYTPFSFYCEVENILDCLFLNQFLRHRGIIDENLYNEALYQRFLPIVKKEIWNWKMGREKSRPIYAVDKETRKKMKQAAILCKSESPSISFEAIRRLLERVDKGNLPSVRGKGLPFNLQGFFRRIVQNILKEEYRKEKRRKGITLDSYPMRKQKRNFSTDNEESLDRGMQEQIEDFYDDERFGLTEDEDDLPSGFQIIEPKQVEAARPESKTYQPLTPKQLSEKCGVSLTDIYYYLQKGDLKAKRKKWIYQIGKRESQRFQKVLREKMKKRNYSNWIAYIKKERGYKDRSGARKFIEKLIWKRIRDKYFFYEDPVSDKEYNLLRKDYKTGVALSRIRISLTEQEQEDQKRLEEAIKESSNC